MAGSAGGDASDFIRTFPQYTLDDYLFRLSMARVQMLECDNTHVKYLKGKDKKIWENYKSIIKAQSELETFIDSMTENKEI